MKSVMLALAILLGVIVLGGMSAFGIYSNVYNANTNYKSQIKSLDKNSQVTLSNYVLKIREAAQIPNKYAAQLSQHVKDTFNGRYGDDGQKAVVSFMTENNIPFDNTLLVNLQTLIASGRDEFRITQTQKISYCAQYEAFRGQLMNSIMLNFIEPTMSSDIASRCEVVTDQTTSDAFKSGKMEALEIN